MKDLIKIYCNSKSVSHQPTNGDILWRWKENPYETECFVEVEKDVFESEIRKSYGLRVMFEEGILYIKDEEIIEKVNLDVEDKYIMNKKDLENFIDTCGKEDFEDFLKFASKGMIDLVDEIYTNKELTDKNKTSLYRDYTGKDLEEFYKDNQNKEENGKKEEIKQGRKARTPIKK